MKIIFFILMTLALTGCIGERDWHMVNPKDLKYKAGQHVKANVHFYVNCDGYITGFSNVYDRNTGEYDYKVKFDCPNTTSLEEVYISESNLLAVEN